MELFGLPCRPGGSTGDMFELILLANAHVLGGGNLFGRWLLAPSLTPLGG